MNYKQLVSLREARVKRLTQEAKEMEQETKERESQSIRDTIMRK